MEIVIKQLLAHKARRLSIITRNRKATHGFTLSVAYFTDKGYFEPSIAIGRHHWRLQIAWE